MEANEVSLFQVLLIALDNLRVNKLRSFLTLLGIIIGVGTVVIMISIVEGARANVIKQFESVGSNLIYVIYAPEQRQSGQGRGTFRGLTMRDVKAIREGCPLIAKISPEMRYQAKARRGTNERLASIVGVGAEVNDVLNIKLARGRRFTEEDEEQRQRVCILGPKIAGHLFDFDDPIGREVVIRDVRLQVVGIMESQGRTMGEDRDAFIYVPLSVMHKRLLGTDVLATINCKAVAPDKVDAACDQIWRLMMRYHDKNVKDFIVDSQERMLKAIGAVLSTFTVVLGGIGALALLVGGIGIMNIMLVSVTERTREIGIRKAVGARQRDILIQFLMESITLSGFGGVFGIAFGAGLSYLVGVVMGERLPTAVPLWACVLAFSFSASVGIFFGIYPAYRAAKLDPIMALRYE
jgi:putative ABC transport system permease protein